MNNCKYDIKATATKKCEICGIGLCDFCGYTIDGHTYCNECYRIVQQGYRDDQNLGLKEQSYKERNADA